MTDSPKDDPRGRWRPGGGINVPVRVEIKPLSKTQAKDVRRCLMNSNIYSQIFDLYTVNCTHVELITSSL